MLNLIIKPIADRISDELGEKLLRDDYIENLWEMYNTTRKVSPQFLIESSLTVEFLEKKRARDQLSILVGGGLITPGHFLKALALGADAVYIGTAAILALIHTESLKSIPWEPPTSLLLYN